MDSTSSAMLKLYEVNCFSREDSRSSKPSMERRPGTAMSRARPVRSRHFRSETFTVSGKVVRERNGSRKAKGMYVNKREERSVVSPRTNDGHQDRGALPKP